MYKINESISLYYFFVFLYIYICTLLKWTRPFTTGGRGGNHWRETGECTVHYGPYGSKAYWTPLFICKSNVIDS
jgi:hypothetical protein